MLLFVMDCIWESVSRILIHFLHSEHSLELILSCKLFISNIFHRSHLERCFLFPGKNCEGLSMAKRSADHRWAMAKRSADHRWAMAKRSADHRWAMAKRSADHRWAMAKRSADHRWAMANRSADHR